MDSAYLSGCSSRQVLSSDYNVIPLPVSISLQEEGTPFVLKPSTVVYCPEGDSLLLKNAELLTGYVARQVGFELRITHDDQARNIIRLGSGLQAENAEAYTLVVTPQAVEIEGASAAGTFYGVQTLRKSLPVTDGKVRIALAPVRIEDAPRFSYRGLHLDVARHMFPVEFIKKYIDLLALHNMNMFHWHLTDDQGWRIEIKRYPRLTEVGGWRKATLVSHWENPTTSMTRHPTAVITLRMRFGILYVMPQTDMWKLFPRSTSRGICWPPWPLIPNWVVRAVLMRREHVGECTTMCCVPGRKRFMNFSKVCSPKSLPSSPADISI